MRPVVLVLSLFACDSAVDPLMESPDQDAPIVGARFVVRIPSDPAATRGHVGHGWI